MKNKTHSKIQVQHRQKDKTLDYVKRKACIMPNCQSNDVDEEVEKTNGTAFFIRIFLEIVQGHVLCVRQRKELINYDVGQILRKIQKWWGGGAESKKYWKGNYCPKNTPAFFSFVMF